MRGYLGRVFLIFQQSDVGFDVLLGSKHFSEVADCLDYSTTFADDFPHVGWSNCKLKVFYADCVCRLSDSDSFFVVSDVLEKVN